MELGIGRDLFSRFADDYDDMLALLDDAVDLMRARARRLAGVTRTHTPTSAEPLVVVVIDEVANLTAYHPTATYRRDALSRIALLATQGRAVGVVLVCALQDPRKEVLSIRSLFPAKVGLRLDEAEQVRMVLGESARDRGAICDRIAPTVPGVGYVVEDGKVDPRRVRASHVDDAEVRRVARTYAPPRTSAPTERSSVERAPTRTRHPNLAEASPVDAGDADTSTIDRASRPTTRRRKRSARPTGDAA
jgi:S-DNA-T family DNA segregation ATPase FtsK/SpoIIIE